MKKFILSALFFALTFASFGQVGIGIATTDAPDASAILEVRSTTKGVLIPRMNEAEIKAIVAPLEGLMVYCTNFKSLYVFNGTKFIGLILGKADINI
ncbi:MAG: hypothetical protein ACWIPJ_00860 [Polaribacter sp.]